MSTTLKQCETPLSCAYFSDRNMEMLQRGIRQAFKNKTGVSIDYQNPEDLFAIMRVVYINNSSDPYNKVNEQVSYMNQLVMKTALNQIQTGVSQYMGYRKDIDTVSIPLAQPINTSTYGTKIDVGARIGV